MSLVRARTRNVTFAQCKRARGAPQIPIHEHMLVLSKPPEHLDWQNSYRLKGSINIQGSINCLIGL